MRQIVFDTETTGLDTRDGHRIIEIGAVELIDRRLTGRTFHQYINPDRVIDKGAIAVHGITNESLKDKPRFGEIVDDLMKYFEGAELIAHNAAFDVGFLNYELMLCSSSWRKLELHCQILDTLSIAKQLHPGQRNSLDALCRRYSVDNSGRKFHGALLDAELLADVYVFMTGGQAQLFNESASDDKSSQEKNAQLDRILGVSELKVLYADQGEIEKHEAKIEAIKKASGLALWE